MTTEPQPTPTTRAVTERYGEFELPSVDSAPPRFSVPRSAWLAPAFLLALGAAFAVLALLLPTAEPLYRDLLGRLSVGDAPVGAAVSLRLRPFFGAFFVMFGLFAAGSWGRRFRLGASLLLLGALLTFGLDVAFVNLRALFGRAVAPALSDFVLGFALLGAFAWTLLRQGTLPPDELVRSRRRPSRRYPLRLAFAGTVAGLTAFSLSAFLAGPLERLRELALLGGLGPGVLLFFPLFIAVLAGLELVALRAKGGDIRFTVAFLVPALNEAETIAECVRSLDAAAQHYGRVCKLYLVDNGSQDLTRALAELELRRCRALDGAVLECPEPGKSKALNLGLSFVREDIVVRVDADTVVSPDLLSRAIPHFADAGVGAVSGLPLPLESRPLLAKLRAIEVYLNQGFVRLGMSAVDGVLSLSGVFSAYRRECLDTLGGFAEEINGEDTDIVLRIGRLGYRLVNDPSLRVYSEVPRTLGRLREQRLRWFRSTFHVASRNRSAMRERQGVRGTFSLPWALLQVVRRAVTVPLLVFGGVALALTPEALHLRGGAALGAVVVGLPFLVSVFVLGAYRRFGLLPYLLVYPLFRLLRSYYNLEMLFTLPFGEPLRARAQDLGLLGSPEAPPPRSAPR